MITATDDAFCRTHDEAAAVLRYAATGARVRVFRPTPKTWHEKTSDRARAYEVTLERAGREPLAIADAYALPVPAAALRERVRALVEGAPG